MNSEKKELRKVWTGYRINSSCPYIVHVKLNKEETFLVYATKFFATRKARKIAKRLGVILDLSFKPEIR